MRVKKLIFISSYRVPVTVKKNIVLMSRYIFDFLTTIIFNVQMLHTSDIKFVDTAHHGRD